MSSEYLFLQEKIQKLRPDIRSLHEIQHFGVFTCSHLFSITMSWNMLYVPFSPTNEEAECRSFTWLCHRAEQHTKQPCRVQCLLHSCSKSKPCHNVVSESRWQVTCTCFVHYWPWLPHLINPSACCPPSSQCTLEKHFPIGEDERVGRRVVQINFSP